MSEPVELLKDSFFFLNNRYRITDAMRSKVSNMKDKKIFQIIDVFEVEHLHNHIQSLWVRIIYDDDFSARDAFPEGYLQELICPPCP